jgi:hypothetical protein
MLAFMQQRLEPAPAAALDGYRDDRLRRPWEADYAQSQRQDQDRNERQLKEIQQDYEDGMVTAAADHAAGMP